MRKRGADSDTGGVRGGCGCYAVISRGFFGRPDRGNRSFRPNQKQPPVCSPAYYSPPL
ncbi:MAG: hypothetical protein LBP19_10735 [Treponema sp.]|nr:hypothetical protein [Treponema sp.]